MRDVQQDTFIVGSTLPKDNKHSTIISPHSINLVVYSRMDRNTTDVAGMHQGTRAPNKTYPWNLSASSSCYYCVLMVH